MEDRKYSTAQAAKYLVERGIFSPTSNKKSNEVKLRKWRTQRKGPAFIKLTTGTVYYTQSALDVFIKGNSAGGE